MLNTLYSLELVKFKNNYLIHRFSITELPYVNSYIIETINELVIIDLQMNEKNALALKEYTEKLQKPIVAIIITHWHIDHYFGIKIFNQYPIYSTVEIQEDAKNSLNNQILPSIIQDKVEFGDLSYRIKNFPNNHCKNHLVVWIEEIKTIVTGDLCQYNGHLLVYDFQGYIKTLEYLSQHIENYDYLLTGHGKLSTPKAISENLTYIKGCMDIAKKVENKDDYNVMVRKHFKHRSPIHLSLAYLLREDWKDSIS